MLDINGLSKKEIQEEYEDLVFRKVMAIYVQKEGKQILSEIEEEKKNDNTVIDSKAIVKLYDKKERKENLNILWKYSKKLINFAAMIVFVAIVSLSSVVVAFADVREAVIEVLYHIIIEENEKFTQIKLGETTGFIDAEIYDWEGAYGLTYVPEGFSFSEKYSDISYNSVTYIKEDKYFYLDQTTGYFTSHIDTENADLVKNVIVNGSEGIFVQKNGFNTLTWRIGNTLIEIGGTINPDEIIEIAKNVKIFN